MSSYLELKAQAEKLLQQADEVRKQEVAKVVADIRALMDQYGLTVEDIQGVKRARKAGATTPGTVRYRGPNGEPWSGSGRQPGWMKDAIARGANKEDFAV